MSTMPSVGSGTYSPGPNMVCSPEQEKVGSSSIEAIICPVYSDLRILTTVSKIHHDRCIEVLQAEVRRPQVQAVTHIGKQELKRIRVACTGMRTGAPLEGETLP